jgi:antitoxin component YwqK of YwqJK toxin-antitoxin module
MQEFSIFAESDFRMFHGYELNLYPGKSQMKSFIVFLLTFSMVSLSALSQTAVRPKYAPAKSKHKNKTDELERKQGLWKHYNLEGTLIWEVEYLDDRRHGLSKRYYGNGRLMRETEYQYDKKDGIFKRYDYDGVVTEGEYDLGKKANQWTYYYSNGQIRSQGMYVGGQKNGPWQYYSRKGALLKTIVFKDGRDVNDILAEEKKAAEAKKAAKSKANLMKK